MAALPNLNSYNNDRKELMKIRTANDETILFTKSEAREALVKYITDELDMFANDLGTNVKTELGTRIMFKLTTFEHEMVRHIDNKFDTITEKIVDLILNRKIEEEVNKRVEQKLKKIKDSL